MIPTTASTTTKHEEHGQDASVGPGEGDHPAGGALGHVLLGDRVVPSEGAHDRAEGTAVRATHAHRAGRPLVSPPSVMTRTLQFTGWSPVRRPRPRERDAVSGPGRVRRSGGGRAR